MESVNKTTTQNKMILFGTIFRVRHGLAWGMTAEVPLQQGI
jgi:hypothetical protein